MIISPRIFHNTHLILICIYALPQHILLLFLPLSLTSRSFFYPMCASVSSGKHVRSFNHYLRGERQYEIKQDIRKLQSLAFNLGTQILNHTVGLIKNEKKTE